MIVQFVYVKHICCNYHYQVSLQFFHRQSNLTAKQQGIMNSVDSQTNASANPVDINSVALKSNRLKFYRRRGQIYFARAEAVLAQESAFNAFFLKFDEATFYYYRASMAFRACERWRDAAESLTKCANVFLHQKMYSEAAVLFTEASDLYSKIDKIDCVQTIQEAVSIYCDTGRFDVAGKLENDVAMTYFNLMDWDEALIHFRRAADFFVSEQLLDHSDRCLEKAAHCLMEKEEYTKASEVYILIAEGCTRNNLQSFNCIDHLFMALICLLGNPTSKEDKYSIEKYKNIQKYNIDLGNKFFMWKNCKESLFFKNIINFRENPDADAFIDHVYYWDNVKPLNRVSISILKIMYEEIAIEKNRREKEKTKALRREERKTMRAKRELKRKEILYKRGIISTPVPQVEGVTDEQKVDETNENDGKPKEDQEEDDDDEDDDEEEDVLKSVKFVASTKT